MIVFYRDFLPELSTVYGLVCIQQKLNFIAKGIQKSFDVAIPMRALLFLIPNSTCTSKFLSLHNDK